jgi:hypothetical protein
MPPLHERLSALAICRPIFPSEAGLQHELAWQIRPDPRPAHVCREIPIKCDLHADIMARTLMDPTAIKVEYMTKGMNVFHDGRCTRFGIW